MRRIQNSLAAMLVFWVALQAVAAASTDGNAPKPSPDSVISWLRDGNTRFFNGQSARPHTDAKRIALAAKENQAKHALATILSCSDSRVPPEVIFDAGIMDLFVIRVAGNVANTDETGTAEYGMLHVNTPLLVVLGHSQCGAVTAVTDEVTGHGHELERNIPPLVECIVPAVKRAMSATPGLAGPELVNRAIEENVWETVRNLFLKSPAIRNQVQAGKIKVVGALYDMNSGGVKWLPEAKAVAILAEANASPHRAQNPMYEKDKPIAPTPAQPAQEDPSVAQKIREAVAKVEGRITDASSGIQELKGRTDALAQQLKKFEEALKLGSAESDTLKALGAEVRSMKSAQDAKRADPGETGWLMWVIIAFTGLNACGLILVLVKLGRFDERHEELRSKTRNAIERLNTAIKQLGE